MNERRRQAWFWSACGAALFCGGIAISGTGESDPPPAPAASHPGDAPALRYDRDVRPLLSDRCFRCHGPDAAKRQADLRLDVAESAAAARAEGAAIVPFAPDSSELLKRVAHPDLKERMPPPSSGKRPFSTEELSTLRRWIAEGAQYESHWSFVPPARPAVPAVGHADWPINAVDRFVLERLEREGFAPSPDADRATLLRRVFLDLTGLPPTPEELDAFLADAAPDAYERVVHRLLTEEPYVDRYAERMATPWLDAARYADTCGIHTDAGRQIWPWRDWVLKALRDGMPFDRFLTEQLAGDLLPNATEDQVVASGFNRNHVTSDEGGAIAEEYLVEYAVERASTTGEVFLGLTVGCARCHEHKFDPLSQEEFYRFYAFFNSIEEPGLYSQLPDSNRAFEPFVEVPTPEQTAALAKASAELASEKTALDAPVAEEDALRAKFFADAVHDGGVEWVESKLTAATSAEGATLAIEPDGSALASGANPARDDHQLTLHTEAQDLRLVLLEALPDPSLAGDRAGRAFNGNAVLTSVEAVAVSTADPARREPLRFTWAWADHEQGDGDYGVTNVLDADDDRGWAIDGHRVAGGRLLLLLAEKPFGFAGGTEVEVKLAYRSIYDQHVLGRPRLRLGRIGDAGLERLPLARSAWYLAGPFIGESTAKDYDAAFGPEEGDRLDFARNFGFGNQTWRFAPGFADGRLNGGLPDGTNASYVGRRWYAPTARTIHAQLGSDDGLQLYLDGTRVLERRIDRSLAADQDAVDLAVKAGPGTLVMKVVNSGGVAGFYFRGDRRENELDGDLVAGILPADALTAGFAQRLERAWKTAYSPAFRARTERIAALEQRIAEIRGQVPRTMVMHEAAMPRDTFVLTRGQYDHPDAQRKVERGVPAALGDWPEGAPKNRLGLAEWMTSAKNPLVARVAVNRTWELIFGTGLVRTSEDFGHQGEWPSHPELLDWLAVEFRESGWDVKRLLTLLVTSRTYRQSSRVPAALHEADPDDRWLGWFPRRRLSAESIRDQALYVSGLLVEKLGGPSVKPYQPDGLWQEVAMPASNTRFFVRGAGDELWRRSLYTYWKRACPPPSLLTLDAPTRETCTVRRSTTNTPLQALVLWNDEQFVEAARVLAQRTLGEATDDAARIERMTRRCLGRDPDADERDALLAALGAFRERYRAAPDDAARLLKSGMAPLPADADAPDLAAWTMVANALLNLDETLCRG